MDKLESEVYGPFLRLVSPWVPRIHSQDTAGKALSPDSTHPQRRVRPLRALPFLITAFLMFLRFAYYTFGTFGVHPLSYEWAWVNIQSMEAMIGWLSLMSVYKAGVKRGYFQRYLQLLPDAVGSRPLVRAVKGTIVVFVLYLSALVFSIVCRVRTDPWPSTLLGWVGMVVEHSATLVSGYFGAVGLAIHRLSYTVAKENFRQLHVEVAELADGNQLMGDVHRLRALERRHLAFVRLAQLSCQSLKELTLTLFPPGFFMFVYAILAMAAIPAPAGHDTVMWKVNLNNWILLGGMLKFGSVGVAHALSRKVGGGL